MRLRTVSPSMKGWTRVRRGRGFRYVDASGAPLAADEVARIRSLAIPPAWRDVWISPVANGHLQALGTDDAGRRQYLYHPAWREQRDRLKFDRVLAAAERLPVARRRVARDLAGDQMTLTRAGALAVRLLDLGYFRIGNGAYSDAHGSFGLTTLERQHLALQGGKLVFAFTGKHGVQQEITVTDPEVLRAITTLRRRRDGSSRLLAYRAGTTWHELTSADVNAYLAELFGGEITAKDFRTWHATVLAAAALAASDEPGTSAASRKRAVRAAVVQVSEFLGNTPAVARNSYVDPRVIDLYESGSTIDKSLLTSRRSPARQQEVLERAVRELLS